MAENNKKANTNMPKENIGFRLILFRKAIKKTPKEISSELGIDLSEWEKYEKGTASPKINYLHYFYTNYGLNLNWLIGEDGVMFSDSIPPESLDKNFTWKPTPNNDSFENERYQELFELMQIPVIEKAIMESLKEIKEEIKKARKKP